MGLKLWHQEYIQSYTTLEPTQQYQVLKIASKSFMLKHRNKRSCKKIKLSSNNYANHQTSTEEESNINILKTINGVISILIGNGQEFLNTDAHGMQNVLMITNLNLLVIKLQYLRTNFQEKKTISTHISTTITKLKEHNGIYQHLKFSFQDLKKESISSIVIYHHQDIRSTIMKMTQTNAELFFSRPNLVRRYKQIIIFSIKQKESHYQKNL